MNRSRTVLGLVLALAAVSPVATPAPVAAAEAPRVVSHTPGDAADAVTTHARIVIRFDQPVRLVGDPGRTIWIGDRTAHRYVCITGWLADKGRALVLRPARGCACPASIRRRAWQPGHDYEVWVGDNVRSRRSGAHLATVHWNFSVVSAG